MQGTRLAQLLLGQVVVLPDNMLLVHDVAADNASVSIHDDSTVPALADRAYLTLRDACHVTGIAELIVLLLLHVIGHDTLAGHQHPEVLVLVDIHPRRDVALDAHLTESLLHVALEGLCLRMVDAETRRGLHPQGTVQTLLNTDDIAVGQGRTVARVALETAERIAVIAIQSTGCSQPDIAL